ncbi:D-alanyl-D-alanine carboxypeptidase [Kyrpidia spormannii]|uniref:D-alanyl-D-alanine carboxypeptidase n=2 Tax=Kyrpidia spormannii TaxID=2055160 RepID=A0ACA8Z4F1_9BACL|nr:D-alanyl-D-alanine carboxypeptidase [Kyrpidia spormannii]CAB3389632.1 D-alanyl-D-alanine carboxypeptidase [Kyrpidia spormannii]
MVGRIQRRWFVGFVAVVVFLAAVVAGMPMKGQAAGVVWPAPPHLTTPSAVLMDAATGQILYEKGADDKRYPASMTKMMTLYLTFEAIHDGKAHLDDIVPISQNAYNTGGSEVYLDPREKFTLKDMITFVAVHSANDAAVAIAEYVGGSVGQFVKRMNEKAQELGLTHTHFVNPDGLHDPNHYTTARDMAVLARDLITKYPEVLDYTKIHDMWIRNHTFDVSATNNLLGKYPGMDGLKTGFTDQAGYCLTATAQQGGVRLISVIMKDPDDQSRQKDTTALLDYGFKNFTPLPLLKPGDPLDVKAEVPDGVIESLSVTTQVPLAPLVPEGTKADALVRTVEWTPGLKAPVAQGQQVGTVSYRLGDQQLLQLPLYALEKDDKAGFIRMMFRGLIHFVTGAVESVFKRL